MSFNVSRRQFIKSAVVSTSSAALLSGCGQTSMKSNNKCGQLHLGTVTYNLARDWDVDTIIANCTKTKFEAVELRTTHAHKVEVNLNTRQRREIRRKFDDSPVKLVSLGSAFEYHSDDPAAVRRNIEGTKEYSILAYDVGAKGIKVRPNGLQLKKGIPEEETLMQIGKSLKEVGEFAKGYGIEIRVEVHGKETSFIPRMKKMIDYSECDNVYICWNSSRNDLTGEGFEANFEMVKSKIHLVHMHELWSEEYPYRKLFKLLKESGYKGYCLAEIPATSEPIRLMRYYRALFLAYQNLL